MGKPVSERRSLGPVHLRVQMVLLVVSLIAEEDVVEPAVVAHRIGPAVLPRCPDVLIVVRQNRNKRSGVKDRHEEEEKVSPGKDQVSSQTENANAELKPEVPPASLPFDLAIGLDNAAPEQSQGAVGEGILGLAVPAERARPRVISGAVGFPLSVIPKAVVVPVVEPTERQGDPDIDRIDGGIGPVCRLMLEPGRVQEIVSRNGMKAAAARNHALCHGGSAVGARIRQKPERPEKSTPRREM